MVKSLKYSQPIVLDRIYYVASEVVKEPGRTPETWVLSDVAPFIKTRNT